MLRAELVVTDDRQRRLAVVPVDFDKRVERGDGLVSLLGQSPDGSLRVSLDASSPPTGVNMRFHFRPDQRTTPTALREIVSWFDSLRSDRRLGLWMRDRGKWGIGPEPIGSDLPRMPDDYGRAVRVLARIEQRAGVSFDMPDEITDEEAEAIGVADALVKGKTVTGRWDGASVNDDPDLLELLEDSPHGALLEFRATHALRLADRNVEIGEVEYRFLQVEFADHDQEQHVIRLRPGGRSDRFEMRLVAVAQRPRNDGETAWVPQAMLEAFAGRWVAQSGTEILDSSDSFEDLAVRLKGSGRLATVWRVPDSQERAEAYPLIAL